MTENLVQLGINSIKAAKRAGVSCIVRSSAMGADENHDRTLALPSEKGAGALRHSLHYFAAECVLLEFSTDDIARKFSSAVQKQVRYVESPRNKPVCRTISQNESEMLSLWNSSLRFRGDINSEPR